MADGQVNEVKPTAPATASPVTVNTPTTPKVAPPLISSDPKPAPSIAESDDALLAKFAAKGHDIKVIEQTDPSQMYPYLVRCSCGWAGRCNSPVQAKGLQMQHLHAQSRGVF